MATNAYTVAEAKSAAVTASKNEYAGDERSWSIAPHSLSTLLFSIIGAQIDRNVRLGQTSDSARAKFMMARAEKRQTNDLSIDEKSLGFDSLTRLELISEVSTFFGLHETGIDDFLLIQRSVDEWLTLIRQHLRLKARDHVLTFSTSGSTSTPKRCAHLLTDLEIEVRGFCVDVLGQHPQRVVPLVPTHRIYGFLFGLLLPDLLSIPSIEGSTKSFAGIIASANTGDVVVATPFQWNKLAATGLRFPRGVMGLVSGAPSDHETWHNAQSIGVERLIEIYGSSETAGVGWRSSPDADFLLLSHLRRTGESVSRIRRPDELLDLQDNIHWTGDGTFQVIGRKDQVVQVAGSNVSIAHVTKTICAQPGVHETAVRLATDRLRALVVPSDPKADLSDLESRLTSALARLLPAHARPTAYDFGSVLPVDETGKAKQWW